MRFQTCCLVAVASLSFVACGDDDDNGRAPFDTNSFADSVEMTPEDGVAHGDLSGKYRDDLANHPGCTPRSTYTGNTEPLVDNSLNSATRPASTPANIAGYPCAAAEWTQSNEDTSKPIVILVHGNSSGTGSWEEYDFAPNRGNPRGTFSGVNVTVDSTAREQLASKLIAARYRVYGFDARTDLTASDAANADNLSRNMDHGWAVPMLQSMVKAVLAANPNRKISLVGHSLGVTIIRDTLRRLFVEYGKDPENNVNPFARVQDLVYLSGANHGVSYFGVANACTLPVPPSATRQMTTYVNCELGNRDAFIPNYFSFPITGTNDEWATPCADGNTAFGTADACNGNSVQYTTVVMQDIAAGDLQDEFVSEASAALNSGQAIDNHLISLDDYDTSGYFYDAARAVFANHFGSARANVGMDYILQKLGD